MRCLSLFEAWLLDLSLLIALVSYLLHVQRAKEAAYIASHFRRSGAAGCSLQRRPEIWSWQRGLVFAVVYDIMSRAAQAEKLFFLLAGKLYL